MSLLLITTMLTDDDEPMRHRTTATETGTTFGRNGESIFSKSKGRFKASKIKGVSRGTKPSILCHKKLCYHRGTARRAKYVSRNLVNCCSRKKYIKSTTNRSDGVRAIVYGRLTCSKQPRCIDCRKCGQQAGSSTVLLTARSTIRGEVFQV